MALLVSKQDWSPLLFESVLGPAGYAVVRAYSGGQALERLNGIAADVIFIDARLPDMDCPDLCQALRAHPNVSPSVPLLVMAFHPLEREERLSALRAGAWDCVRLPTDAEQLLLQVESYLRAKAEADRAREQGLVDASTGLYSMRGVLQRARELAAEASRYRRPLACIVVAYGTGEPGAEAALDERTMEELAAALGANHRSCDAIGRLGPAEFVVLTPETNEEGARRAAERLAVAIEELNRTRATGDASALPLHIRIGGYAVEDFEREGIEPGDLLTRATLALRGSPPNGPKSIRFYRDDPTPLH